jgi:beta-1,2-mannobiose phosphorylase / 1,2-beta-oligomannan phosphorylase
MEVSRIGMATLDKNDKILKRTVLIEPEESWEAYGCEDPRVTFLEDNYYICYTGLSTYPFNPAGIKIAMAKTEDFETIERHLVTPFNAKAMAIFPERINGKVAAILTVDSDIPPSSICVALADDISDFWNYEYWDRWYTYKQRNTLPLLRSLADHIEVGCPPIKTKDGWLVIYSYISAYLTNTKIFAVEAVLLDLENPLTILARLPYSLLHPEAPYEKKGVIENIVFPTGVTIKGDQLSLYYGGADAVCAVAHGSVKHILSEFKKYPLL